MRFVYLLLLRRPKLSHRIRSLVEMTERVSAGIEQDDGWNRAELTVLEEAVHDVEVFVPRHNAHLELAACLRDFIDHRQVIGAVPTPVLGEHQRLQWLRKVLERIDVNVRLFENALAPL